MYIYIHIYIYSQSFLRNWGPSGSLRGFVPTGAFANTVLSLSKRFVALERFENTVLSLRAR